MNILTIATGYGMSKPLSGGQNRFSNLIKSLKKNGNEICVLESKKNLDSLDSEIANVFTYRNYRFFNRTLVLFKDFNFDFIWNVYKILKNENIELIQLSHPSGIFVTKILTKIMRKNIPIVYDAHNVEYNYLTESFRNNPKYSILERFILPWYVLFLEKLTCKYIVDHITSVSNEDRAIFIQKYSVSGEKVSVIPSGCYIFDFNDKMSKDDIKFSMGIDSDRLIIFFHGLYSHYPNKEAFEIIKNYIAPEFEKTNENILFVLGGSKVPKYERANIKSLGFIKDLHSVLAVVDISIVPLTHGAGTKLKIFDYMSAGLPIISTKKGMEGIEAKNDEHAIIVDDVNNAFIKAIKYLVNNKRERKRIGANARRLAEEEYDWDKIGEKLNALYKRIVAERSNANK